MRWHKPVRFPHSCYPVTVHAPFLHGSCAGEGGVMTDSKRLVARRAGLLAVLVAVAIAGRSPAWAEVAATGIFGIDVHGSFPNYTFDGRISSFDAGPFSVGGTAVTLGTDIQKMDILSGVIS